VGAMENPKDDLVRQFGRNAEAYATSPGHARGPDLDIVLRLLAPESWMTVLDLATGPGHTALAVAPFVREIAGVDLTPQMVDLARREAANRGITNFVATLMDVESLEFPDGSFDAATCRIAPHHFPDVKRSLREIRRVLHGGARFVLEDSCAPSDPALDRLLNDIERLRDPTHVRSYTRDEWVAMLEDVGLEVLHAEIYRKVHDFADWVRRAGLDEAGIASIERSLLDAGEAARDHFEIRSERSRILSFTDDKLILRADKPGVLYREGR
jgi:SAM-dependent methyltransferase